VVSPRGLVNAFTQQPAPSVVAPGGILHINGINLGPPSGVTAAGAPLPTQLGDPPVEVLLNGQPAPLFSAHPERIVAQVPWEAEAGLAQVTVRRGGVESKPARVLINALAPSVRTAGDQGYGEADAKVSGRILTLSAFGLGQTQPRVNSGEAGPEDPPARPRQTVEVYVGGLPAKSGATLSKDRVGEFDIRIELPPGAQPGDVITVKAGNANAGFRVANRTTFQKSPGAELLYLPVPEGAPELRSLVTSDLRGSFVVASGARGDDGCYPSYLFDLAQKKVAKIAECLTAAARNAATPVVAATDGAALAALVGPPAGDAQTGISAKVLILHPAREPMTVELEAPVSELRAAAGGDFEAVAPGTPPRRFVIDAETGEVRTAAPAAGGGGVPAGIPGKLDLGDGVTQVLAFLVVPPNQIAVIAGDDANQPKKAKMALLNAKGEILGTKDFPEGWAPLVAPLRPQAPAVQPAGQPVAALAGLRRLSVNLDADKGIFYVLVRSADGARHAVAAFDSLEAPAKLVPLPEGWFVAACAPAIPLYNLELSRKLAFLGSLVAETEIKDPCPGSGFLLLDLESQTFTAVPLPGRGQFDADAGASGDVNDFVYGTNTDPERRNTADTLFVLDSVTASAFRMDLPAGVTAFAAPRAVPAMNALIAQATNRTAGDAGLVIFDLDRAEARVLPVPDGFQVINLLEVFTTTRKVAARGIKAAGTQYLIYDLLSGDLEMPPNPEGVASVGGPAPRAGQAAGGGQQLPGGGTQPGGGAAQPQAPQIQQRPNAKANTVTGFAYSGEGKQLGVVVLRVP
jgi:uncharacterized protein (TIGR03437 family)